MLHELLKCRPLGEQVMHSPESLRSCSACSIVSGTVRQVQAQLQCCVQMVQDEQFLACKSQCGTCLCIKGKSLQQLRALKRSLETPPKAMLEYPRNTVQSDANSPKSWLRTLPSPSLASRNSPKSKEFTASEPLRKGSECPLSWVSAHFRSFPATS